MGDVSFNMPINAERPPVSIAEANKVGELMSVGWTNESHSLYISSMESSFMQQLHGNEHQAPYQNRGHAGGNGFKALQQRAADNLRSQRNDSCTRDEGIRGLPENPWIRRFKPRNSSIDCRGDRLGASSVDDGESGTDTVEESVWTQGREVKSLFKENIAEVSGQNFLDGDVKSTTRLSKSCKKRRPTRSTAACCSILSSHATTAAKRR